MQKRPRFTSIFKTKANWLSKSLPILGLLVISLAGCSPAVGENQLTETPAFAVQEQEASDPAGVNLSFPLETPAAIPGSPRNEEEVATPVYFTPTPSPAITPQHYASFQFCSPLEDHSLTDLQEIISFPYDPPPIGKDTGHHGVDFAYYRRGERLSILGVPIQSVLAGKVVAVNQNLVPYGYMVIIETLYEQLPERVVEHVGIPPDQSLYLLYAHMNEPPLAEEGKQVKCGDRLGYVGNTPEDWSSAPHLHFEARIGPAGGQFSGMQFYDKRSQVDQMEKYTLWRMSGDYSLLDPMALLVYGLSLDPGAGD
jgi:murein DD-endopeptidase MepM/ murein hydrolase activator NlpD